MEGKSDMTTPNSSTSSTAAATVTRTRLVRGDDRSNRVVEFNYDDRFGRQIGVCIMTSTDTFIDLTPEEVEETRRSYRSFYSKPAGTYFMLDMQVTRNGKLYGASQRTQYFATAAERQTAIDKRLAHNAKATQKMGVARG